MRILFLDVDGVLNSQHWYHSEACQLARARLGAKPGTSPSQWSASELYGCHIDPEALALLEDCIRDLGLSLVLSSTWRLLPRGLEALAQAGLSFIGTTPEVSTGRSGEIQAWLDANGVTGDFAIVDDHEDMAHLRSHWVQTYFCSGFTKREARELRERFNFQAQRGE